MATAPASPGAGTLNAAGNAVPAHATAAAATTAGSSARRGLPVLGRPDVRLFLTSFLALYAELLCIRWIPAHVRFVSYFTNFILLASFLGLGVGILSARRAADRSAAKAGLAGGSATRADGTSGRTWGGASWLGLRLFPWLMLAIVALVAATRFELHIESAGVLYYGASEGGAAPAENALVLPAAFLLVALLFTCIGRYLGRLLAEVTPPLRAYGVDIGGSLAGVASFFVLSLMEQPPAVWFGGLAALVLLLARNWRDLVLAPPPLGAALVIAHSIGGSFWWSPYYRVGLTPMEDHPQGWVLSVNSIGHQIIMPAVEKEPFYRVPYEIFGDNTVKRAMIIGAGSGSDVAMALAHGVAHVDAVEIDPVISRLGHQYHPDQPYADPRVTVHVDDGRAFLRRPGEPYDLIIFALPDSLTLTSQFSSLRLESFLFTEQAFRDARSRLDDNGVLVLYNFYRETWLLRKLAGMLESTFGHPPYVVSYGGWGRAAVLMAGPRLEAARRVLPELGQPYTEQLSEQHTLADDPNAALLPVIGLGALASTNTAGDTREGAIAAATDDWPLMYLPVPGIPGIYLAALAMVVGCALGLILGTAGPSALRGFNAQMFFLGAAFMLLETRSLVTFALLFGSTWIVNSLVFFAILCSVLLAVLAGAFWKIRPSRTLFGLLFAALLVAYLLPDDALLGLTSPTLRYTIAAVVAFLPIFLANLVFAGAFRLTGRQADVAFASNLLGAMVGGMLEYVALALGYRHLLVLAIVSYALAAVAPSRPWTVVTSRLGRRLNRSAMPVAG